MRRARHEDIPALVELMASFYAESGYDLDRLYAEKAFATLLSNDNLGCVWLITDEGVNVGHVVVTFRIGMEYGGLIARDNGDREIAAKAARLFSWFAAGSPGGIGCRG